MPKDETGCDQLGATKDERATSCLSNEELLELSGWIKAEVGRIRDAARDWSGNCCSDKRFCFYLCDELAGLDEMAKSMIHQPTREKVREKLKAQDELPF